MKDEETGEVFEPIEQRILARGDRVRYIPKNEVGTVTSTNALYVFVCFDGHNSQACYRKDLELLEQQNDNVSKQG